MDHLQLTRINDATELAASKIFSVHSSLRSSNSHCDRDDEHLLFSSEALSASPSGRSRSVHSRGYSRSPVVDETSFDGPAVHRRKRYTTSRSGSNFTRRVLHPVKGSNKTGKIGKLKCTECRKIRSKVGCSANRVYFY